MLYRSYREKLKKRNTFLIKLWKLRFVIAAVLLLLVAGAALLAVTGSVYYDDFEAQIFYGESLKANSSSLFKPVGYEFRTLGGAWSGEQPTRAGSYEVRAFSTDIAGSVRYGKIHSYKILPAPVEIMITDDNLDYGSAPACSAELRYGDVLYAVDFEFEALEDGNFNVWARRGAIKILNGAGEDVTDCYELKPVKKTVINTPRPITVQTPSASFEYDGARHCAEGLEVTSALQLLEGHTLEATGYPELCEVSQTENIPAVTVKDGRGADVTRYYSIDIDAGALAVTPRDITIATGSQKFGYDGEPHSAGFYNLSSGALAAGDVLDIEYISVTDAGDYPNEPLSLGVSDDGVDKTGNYNITLKAGTISVAKRAITVETPSGSWTYNGEEHFLNAFTYSGALEGHAFSGEATGCAKITDAGSMPNTVEIDYFVSAADGADVTKNYALSYKTGTLAVTPRVFRVKTGGAEWVYDGKPHTCLDFTLLQAEDGEGLLRGAEASALSDGVTQITDTNAVAYADNVLSFTVTHNGRDVSRNYKAEGEWGKLRIKSPVQITVFSKSKQYDGSPLSYSSSDYAVTRVPPDVEKAWVTAEIKGELNTVGHLTLSEIAQMSSASLTDGTGADRTLNGENRIDFVGESEPLEILPRTIEVTSVSVSSKPNGEPLSGNRGEGSGWISLGSLLEGHRIEITVGGELSPAEALAPNTITSVIIYDLHGNNVTELYSITLRPGTLKWI